MSVPDGLGAEHALATGDVTLDVLLAVIGVGRGGHVVIRLMLPGQVVQMVQMLLGETIQTSQMVGKTRQARKSGSKLGWQKQRVRRRNARGEISHGWQTGVGS